jgi:hypothetical protein
MAEAKRLEQFLAVPTDEGADITIQVEGTAPVTVSVSLEQVEDILDMLDDVLDAEDDGDEDEEDEEFEEN